MKKYPYLEKIAKKSIDECKKNDAVLLTTICGFLTDTEALNLRDLLLYAYDRGVLVHFVPLEVWKNNEKLDKK